MTTIPQVLFEQAARRPEALAIKDGKWRLSYAELSTLVKKAAGIMREMGVSHGDKFGICLLYTSPSPRDGLLSRMPSSA